MTPLEHALAKAASIQRAVRMERAAAKRKARVVTIFKPLRDTAESVHQFVLEQFTPQARKLAR